jgi:uncharacterized protein (TIGR01319 family)
MSRALLIDVGSTFTKVASVDLEEGILLGTSRSCTTVEEDVNIGLQQAISCLPEEARSGVSFSLACSSAAGGLRMICIGLVPELTAEAGRKAALSAGAKMVGFFAYKISVKEIHEIETLKPDIVILSGGTDGGNSETILYNAQKLADSSLECDFVIAGNKSAVDEVCQILGSKKTTCTENVLPSLDVLNIEPAKAVIREIFLNHIIHAKGIDKIRSMAEILMPTPMAVLNAARLIAEGNGKEAGLGELLIVDVGGATTDVHSVATGHPAEAQMIVKGLPEPYVKRTVEGDIGVRYNADTLIGLITAGKDEGIDRTVFCQEAHDFTSCIDRIPSSDEEMFMDAYMAKVAVRTAVGRHAGSVQHFYTSLGEVQVLKGKDLRGVKTVIGTGGPLVFNSHHRMILEGSLYSLEEPFSLRPTAPEFYIDDRYLLYGVGLLAERYPEAALKLIKKNLRREPYGV